MASDVYKAHSAGTEIKKEINFDAVHTIQKLYGVDMTATQHPKLLSALPKMDIVVTMGCGVECLYLSCKRRKDWGLDDPTGQSEEIFEQTAKMIEGKVLNLKKQIVSAGR